MNAKRTKELTEYMAYVAVELGLDNWKLMIADAPCEPENYATVSVTEFRDIAVVSVGEDFFTLDPKVARISIVHELTHCILEPIMWQGDTLAGTLGGPAYSVFREGLRGAMELATDRLATLLALTVKLPEWETD